MNNFVGQITSHDALTENGALSHSTTGDLTLDYFSKAGTYRNRTEQEVAGDISAAWNESPELALKTIFYLRSVTRKTKGFFESEKVTKGQGVRDEFIKLVKWLENNHPETLYKNLWLIPVVGTWKDLWYDSAESGYVHYINTDEVYKLVERGLTDEYNRGLLAKYLPRIRSKSNVKNERHARLNTWAKGLCDFLGWSEKDYRTFKSNPENTAHLFQRVMCGGLWQNLDFSVISGKALFNLMALKGKDGKTVFQRHGLEEKYVEWLKTQPTAKFTGYVYELFKQVSKNGMLPLPQKITFDKQFDGLVELAKKDGGGLKGNVWCALDTSGSMGSIVDGKDTSAFDVCISLGIYFSALNEGAFKDHVVMFDDTSRVLKINGSFTDKATQIMRHTTAWGSTNFMSVIDEICRVRKSNPNIPLSDFPETLLVVSDMQFNATGTAQTNYERAMEKLAAVGLPKIDIIWWNVTARGRDYTNKSTDEGVTMLSGFDGSTIQLILGGDMVVVDEKTGETRKLTPMEQMIKVLDQEVLNQLKA